MTIKSWAKSISLEDLMGFHRGAMLGYKEAIDTGHFLTAAAALHEAKMMKRVLLPRLKRLERSHDKKEAGKN